MVEFPIWVWAVAVLGVIAAGIGLGYLIIFLFWKIERYYESKAAISNYHPAEANIEAVKLPEPVEDLEIEKDSIEIMNEEVKEVIAPIMAESTPDEKNRLIKFTTTLHSKFHHLFQEANTIVCWDLALENGDEVRDTEDNIMEFQVIEPTNEAERKRYILFDNTGRRTISVIPGKDYLKRETNIDFDKMRMG